MELGKYLYVDPTSPTGLRWTDKIRKSQAGKPCGTITKKGYYQTKLHGKLYYNHRLVAFLSGMLSVVSSEMQIDHIDGNPSNNCPTNLRVCTRRQNMQNCKRHREGRLVGARPSGGKWLSWIRVDGVPEYLGCFPTEEAAHAAYVARLHRMGESLLVSDVLV